MVDEPVIVAPPEPAAVEKAGEGAKEVAKVEADAAVAIAKVEADAATAIADKAADVQKTAIAAAEQETGFRKELDQCQANIASLTEQTQKHDSDLQLILSKLTPKEAPKSAPNPSPEKSADVPPAPAPEPAPVRKRRLRLI